MTRRAVPFFCDQCGVELSTGYACPVCKRILCHKHYVSAATGRKRRDGLCPLCVAKAASESTNLKKDSITR